MRTLIRTNLATNPRGTSLFQSYSVSLPTMTVEAVEDHPEGIKTANRITYAANQSNPGILYFPAPYEINTPYIMSAWVKHDAENGASSITWGHALSSVAGQNVAATVEKGNWEQVVWSYNTTNTTSEGFGFRKVTSSVGGSYLITGITIEKASSFEGFYDGAKLETFYDFYKWTGTPNASTSERYRIERMENFNPQLALADAKKKSMEIILGSNPVKTQNGTLLDNQYAAMEKVLRDNALIV